MHVCCAAVGLYVPLALIDLIGGSVFYIIHMTSPGVIGRTVHTFFRVV